MNTPKIILALGLLAAVSAPAIAQTAEAPTAEQCTGWFDKADANKDGSLGQNEESAKYAELIAKGSAADNNSGTTATATILEKQAFLDACAKGSFGMPTM